MVSYSHSKRLEIFIDIENKNMVQIAKRLAISERCITENNGVVCYACRIRVDWDVIDKITEMTHLIRNYRLLCSNCMHCVHSKTRRAKLKFYRECKKKLHRKIPTMLS